MNVFSRILIPMDGSELSERALPYAISLAHKYDSDLILLRVLDLPEFAATHHPEEQWMQEAVQAGYREAQSYLNAIQAKLTEQGIGARSVILQESPAEDILFLASSEEVDLIVMSSHGKGEALRWTAGSVADKVMQHSPCPVLLVRQTAK
jgi:nucleotide-binding universal stress UspA family protein